MKKLLFAILVILLLAAAGSAGARPAGCVYLVNAATRDAAVRDLQVLMGAATMLDDTMVDMAVLQDAARVIGELQAAPGLGCGGAVQ